MKAEVFMTKLPPCCLGYRCPVGTQLKKSYAISNWLVTIQSESLLLNKRMFGALKLKWRRSIDDSKILNIFLVIFSLFSVPQNAKAEGELFLIAELVHIAPRYYFWVIFSRSLDLFIWRHILLQRLISSEERSDSDFDVDIETLSEDTGDSESMPSRSGSPRKTGEHSPRAKKMKIHRRGKDKLSLT